MESNNLKTLAPIDRLFILGLSLLAVLLMIVSTSRGRAGLSPDSIVYIATARNIVNGLGATTYNLTDYVDKPPFYPMVLAGIKIALGIDPLVSAPVVNAIALGLVVYLTGLLFANHLSRAWIWWGSAFILFSAPLVGVTAMLWSEPLYIFFMLFFLVEMERFLVRRDLLSFALLTAFAALACITRYIGLVLIPIGAITILLWYRDRFADRLRAALGFSVLASLPIGLWILRNFLLTGTPVGPRWPSSAFTLNQNMDYTLSTFFAWYFLDWVFANRAILLIAGAGVGSAIAMIAGQRSMRWRAGFGRIGPIIWFVGFYTSFLVSLSSTVAYDQLGNRLLSPLFVPLTLLVLVFIEKLTGLLETRLPTPIARTVLLVGLAAWFFFFPFRATIGSLQYRIEHDAEGYATQAWQSSPLIQYLKSQPLQKDRLVYSNDPYALYFFTGMTGELRESPFKRKHYNSYEFANDLATVKANWLAPGTKSYLVWFGARMDSEDTWNFAFAPEELQEVVDMRQILQVEDGAIFVVSKQP